MGDRAASSSSSPLHATPERTNPPFFSLRVVNVDYYLLDLRHCGPQQLAVYYGQRQQEERGQHLHVPVVRIFGTTPMGQKACLHLHGAAPYFLIRPMAMTTPGQPEEPAPPAPPQGAPPQGPPTMQQRWDDVAAVESLFPSLESGIEEAVRVFRRQQQQQQPPQPPPPPPPAPGQAPPPPPPPSGQRGGEGERFKVVKDLQVVQGIPFYGYHKEAVLFIKVTLYDPRLLVRVATALQSGAILDTPFQPYEAHIPFLLQLFIDYNIAGMGYLHIHDQNKTFRFRGPLPEEPSFNELETIANPLDVNVRYRVWLRRLVPSRLIWGESDGGGEEETKADMEPPPPPPPHPPPPCPTPAPAAAADRDSQGGPMHSLDNEVSNLLDGLGSQELFHWSQAPQSSELTGAGHQEDGQPAPVSEGPTRMRASLRSTLCELEVDAHVCDVLNPQLLPRGLSLDSQSSSQPGSQGGATSGKKQGGKGKGQPLAYVPSLREIWEEEMGRRAEVGEGEVSMTDLCLTAESDQMASQRGSSFLDGRWALKELFNLGRRNENLTQDSSVDFSSQGSAKALSQVSAAGQLPHQPGLSMSQQSRSSTMDQDNEPPPIQFSQAQIDLLHRADHAVAMEKRASQEAEARELDGLGALSEDEGEEEEGEMEEEEAAEEGGAERKDGPPRTPARASSASSGIRTGDSSRRGKKRAAGGTPASSPHKKLMGAYSPGAQARRTPESPGTSASSTPPPPPPMRSPRSGPVPSPLPDVTLSQLWAGGAHCLQFYRSPPAAAELQSSLSSIYGLPSVVHPKPFFSKRQDVRDALKHMHHCEDAADFDTGPTIKMALEQHKQSSQKPPARPPSQGGGRQDCDVCLTLAKPKARLYCEGKPFVILRPTQEPPRPESVTQWLLGDKPRCRPVESLDDSSDDEGGGGTKFSSNAMGVLGTGGVLDVQGGGDGGGTSQASTDEGFVMDANTGQLVPRAFGAKPSEPHAAAAASVRQQVVQVGSGGPPLRYRSKLTSQISPPTPTRASITPGSGDRGFKKDPSPVRGDDIIRSSEGNRLTVLSLELHINTRLALRPDPKFDAVAAVCYAVHDYRNWSSEHERVDEYVGVIVSSSALKRPGDQEQRAAHGDQEPGQQDRGGSCAVCKTKDRERFCVCGGSSSSSNNTNGSRQKGSSASGSAGIGPQEGGHQEEVGGGYEGLALGPNVTLHVEADERALFDRTLDLISAFDPEFLVGWEVQVSSLGYMIDRGKQLQPPVDLLKGLGRMRDRPRGVVDITEEKVEDTWGETQSSGIWVVGRHVLNLWRLMRQELKLSIYSLQNVTAHVLGRRLPAFPHQVRTEWFFRGRHTRALVLSDTLQRACLNLQLLDKLDLIGRTAEFARIFGIDFFSVLNRGSQYRVEAVMMRVLKPLNFVVISPSRKQVASQRALEVQPLIHEPVSGFYSDPVAVLDFASLYPSMIIAYNLCFSTYIGCFANEFHRGKVVTTETAGVIPWSKAQTARSLAMLGPSEAKGCFVAPNGAIFCPRSSRQGVLPRMLHEILETRFMIKRAMKRPEYKRNLVLQRVLNARQFGLKMIANVTYGYTSASFSGRMPMAELADAIVSTARSTVERGRHLVESTGDLQPARVVYGDTDSLFVELRGRSRDDAIGVGKVIAQRVSDVNPPGVSLKFEKVYYPCMLVSKKRYVGHAYEEAGGKAHFDAKGLEVVRRDTCPLTVKMQEKVIRILFTTRDVSQVKAYITRQLTKMLEGRVRVQDYVIATEVRLGTYAPGGNPPGSVVVAEKAMSADPMAEPRYGERVPFVVVTGGPNTTLAKKVVDPQRLLGPSAEPGLMINTRYYILKRLIPPLHRLLTLVGVDIAGWFEAMPKPMAPIHHRRQAGPSAVNIQGYLTITNFWHSDRCRLCRQEIRRSIRGGGVVGNENGGGGGQASSSVLAPVCQECASLPASAGFVAAQRRRVVESLVQRLYAICRQCTKTPDLAVGEACTSLDCSVYHERSRCQAKIQDIEDLCQSLLPPERATTDRGEKRRRRGGGNGGGGKGGPPPPPPQP